MKYKFKQIKLSDAERLWLTEILKFNSSEVNIRRLKVKLRNRLPEDFDPDKIDHGLLWNNHLTLVGLWHIDPQNAIFDHVFKIFEIIKDLILRNPEISRVTAKDLSSFIDITEKEAEIALRYIYELGDFFGGGGLTDKYYGMKIAQFRHDNSAYDKFLRFKSLEQEMERSFISRISYGVRKKKNKTSSSQTPDIFSIQQPAQDTWNDIYDNYDVTKRTFGKKINFVTDKYKRKIIFRDVEHAFLLASKGFSKPALILAGGVIEELLRLYLEHKNIKPGKKQFFAYIKTCEDNDLLKRGVSRLTDSIRDFRNLVHLDNEAVKKHAVSKATAQTAIASIFTIVNDF